MKFSKGQVDDIESGTYFIPQEYRDIEITSEDKIKYLGWSERGLHKELDKGKFTNPTTGVEALMLGKSRRGLHVEMWEEGILDGSVPYATLIGLFGNDKKWWQFWKSPHKPLPRPVVNFMKQEMFRGKDTESIEMLYQLHFETAWPFSGLRIIFY